MIHIAYGLAVAAVNFFGIAPTAKVIIGIFFINLVLLGLYVGFSFKNLTTQRLQVFLLF